MILRDMIEMNEILKSKNLVSRVIFYFFWRKLRDFVSSLLEKYICD